MTKILIVEDDAVIAGAIARHAASWGYETACVKDFRHVLEEMRAFSPHLILLDIALPGRNGFHWCQEIRNESSVPVIFISSVSDNMNIVMAIGMGGDDFVAKPFDLNVLWAKVQALLRRTYDFAAAQVLSHKGADLNTADATLTVNGEKVELTRNEYRLMETLLRRRGAIVSRETLMEKLWESDSFVDENTLSVNITRLRRKLESVGLRDYIVTRKGAGYIIE